MASKGASSIAVKRHSSFVLALAGDNVHILLIRTCFKSICMYDTLIPIQRWEFSLAMGSCSIVMDMQSSVVLTSSQFLTSQLVLRSISKVGLPVLNPTNGVPFQHQIGGKDKIYHAPNTQHLPDLGGLGIPNTRALKPKTPWRWW